LLVGVSDHGYIQAALSFVKDFEAASGTWPSLSYVIHNDDPSLMSAKSASFTPMHNLQQEFPHISIFPIEPLRHFFINLTFLFRLFRFFRSRF
jgi:hypothetical protein